MSTNMLKKKEKVLGKTVASLEKKLHDDKKKISNLKEFPSKDQKQNKVKQSVRMDQRQKLIAIAQEIANPHDSFHNRQATILPVNGNVETYCYLDSDTLPVQFPTVTDPDTGITPNQTVGVLYNDVVRNTVTYIPVTGRGSPPNMANKYEYVAQVVSPDYTGTTNLESLPGAQFTVLLSPTALYPAISFYSANSSWKPHGPYLGVGYSERSKGSYVWMNKGDTMTLNCYGAPGSTTVNMTFWQWSPEGELAIGTASFVNIALGSVMQCVAPQDGYYTLSLTSPTIGAAPSGFCTFAVVIGNVNVLGNINSNHVWAHQPVPGFAQICNNMELCRLNGAVLEYHNIGSVTNGELYCGQFSSVNWFNIVNNGFANFKSIVRDNSIKQNTEDPAGVLVRVNLGSGDDDNLKASVRRTSTGSLLQMRFRLEETSAFCIIWADIALGNLGAPQNAVWKKGANVQLMTTDTTRPTSISTLSDAEYRAVKAMVRKVPYWGSNEFHWSEVRDFLSSAIDKAVSIAPAIQSLLSAF